MGRLTLSLIRRFREWERPAQLAMILALLLFLVVIILASVGPPEWRQPAIFGIIGLVLVMQGIALWANRDLVTPFTQAQRLYLAGEFEGARAILEAHRAEADVRSLTLLGNTYRQLGRLAESEAVLREALALDPDHHFPLYGLGMTLLAQGRYAEAQSPLETAVSAGAPPVVRIDLAEAKFRAGDAIDARDLLQGKAEIRSLQPYRLLMARYMLWRLDAGEPPDPTLIADGLPFWRVASERFAHTAYGQALAEDVRRLRAITTQAMDRS